MSQPTVMAFNFSPQGLFAARHLRFRSFWIGVGVLMVLTVIFGSVMSIPSPVSSVTVPDKLVHTLAYACLMAWFAQIYRHDLTRLVFVVGLIAMGIAIEFVQGTTGFRQFEVLDMVANTSGVILAWALTYTRVGNVLLWTEKYVCNIVLKA